MHFTGYGKQGQVNVLLTSIGLCVAELSHAKFSYSAQWVAGHCSAFAIISPPLFVAFVWELGTG